MANVQIPNLPAATSLNGNEQLEAVQAGTSVRVTTDQIAAFVNSEYPAPGVTQVNTAGGLTGGPITSTGTIQIEAGGVTNAKLADMPTATIKGNDGLSSGPPQDLTVGEVSTLLGLAPSATTDTTNAANITSGTLNAGRYSQSISQAIDLSTDATDVEGSILYRGATEWDSLPPGSAGQYLQTGGPSAAPQWVSIPAGGTVTQVNTGTGLTGGPITTTGTIALTNTSVAPGVYGSATESPVVTVDAQGRVTVANNATITPAFASITGKPTTLAGYGITNGVPDSRTITAGTGLTGGGDLSANRTLSIDSTGVTPASYGSQNTVGTFTVNAQGQLTAAGSATINGVTLTTGSITSAPSGANDLVNKAYVDSISAGLNFHEAVDYATAAALPAYTYNNGTSGVGATITANANGALVVDGYTFVSPGDIGKRVLVKNETSTNAPYNGVYNVSQVGSGSLPFILTRSTDYDTAGTGPNEIDAGDFFLVLSGATNANTAYVQQTPLPITVGTTAISFIQFSAGGSTYSAGTGLNLVGSVFNIANTGVSAGSYGSASAVPVLAVNAQGQITSASTAALGTMATQNANAVAITGGSATLTSPSVVSVSSASDALRITQTGAGNALLVEDSANPDATPFVVASDGRVISGYTTTVTVPGAAYLGQFYGTGALYPLAAGYSGASSAGPRISLIKNRSADWSTQTVVNSGDFLGEVNFLGSDGTNFIQGATIAALVDGTPGTGDMPGRLAFYTTPDGSSTLSERMRIDNAGRVGIGGGTPAAWSRVNTFGVWPASGGFSIANYSTGQVPSGATTHASAFWSEPTVAAASFTLPTLSHFNAVQGAFGAGSTVTNQRGFSVDASLISATNNFGFYGNIPAGTGRWNFYANGTADNYFAGQVQLGAGTVSAPALSAFGDTNTGMFFPAADTIAFAEGGVEAMRLDSTGQVGIGTTTPTALLNVVANTSSDAVRITQTGAGNALVVEDETNPDATPFQVNASGQVSIGTTTASGRLNIYDASAAQVFVSGDAATVFNLTRYSSDVSQANIVQRKARGTLASPTAVNSGDGVGLFAFNAYGGTNFRQVGTLQAVVETYTSDTNISGYLAFSTNSGGTTVSEKMRITAAGNVGIGTTTPSVPLEVAGVINDSIGNVRDVPQNSQTGAYVLVASDNGKHISITTGGVTVPAGVFAVGDTVTIFNNSASSQTITQGASVTLRQVGTANTGNRTLAQYGLATILCVASNTFVITGGGLS